MSAMRLVCALTVCVLAGCSGDGELPSGSFDDSAKGGNSGHRDAGSAAPDRDAAVLITSDAGAPATSDAAATTPAGDAAAMVEPTLPVGSDAAAPMQVDPLPVEPPRCTALWYRDADGDSFGAGEPVTSCTQPDGFVERSGDCYDASRFAAPRKPGSGGGLATDRGDGSFDYDCDGVELPARTELVHCPAPTTPGLKCPPSHVREREGGNWDAECEAFALLARASEKAQYAWVDVVPACGETGQHSYRFVWNYATRVHDCVTQSAQQLCF